MKKLSSALCALVLLVVGAGLALAQNDKGVKVFVGYADTFVSPAVSTAQGAHPGPAFTPTPWLGSTDVFIGVAESTTGTFDAGAIRLDNQSEEPLQIDNVTVDIGTFVGIDPWSGCGVAPPCKSVFPFTIPGKGTAILTQTFVPGQPNPPALVPSPPITTVVGAYNFDTSDIPTPGNCVADGLTPLVHVTVGSDVQTTKDFVDDTQVLNTGGVDLGGCSPLANEGHEWVEVHEGQ